jgi:hypothetical protein
MVYYKCPECGIEMEKIHEKAKEKFFKNHPVRKLVTGIKEILYDLKYKRHPEIRGKKQTLEAIETAWAHFLMHELGPYMTEASQEIYNNVNKSQLNDSLKEIDWGEPLRGGG